MDELFRFSITRAAERTDAATLQVSPALTVFRRGLLARSTAGLTLAELDLLRIDALTYIKTKQAWIVGLDIDPAPVRINKLLADLQTDLLTVAPSKWQGLINGAASEPVVAQFSQLSSDLGDLFLALLIVRSGGPARLDRWIRNDSSLVPLTKILLDKPSLNDIADLLRVIDLVMSPPGSFKTVDDVKAALSKTLILPPDIFLGLQKPVHAVGITDLLVVKQHIHHYEWGEIARIENILKGESRGHSQKHTLSNERDTFIQTDKETQTDQELTSTDHVSIKTEIENTLKEDTKLDAGVHVQYDGGSLKAQADVTVAYDRSSSESKKFASDIAKDVTQKAAKKVTDRVTQSVTTKVIETFEELEDQKFENKTGPHVSGVYEWLIKVYLAQIFNYGRHMLFDIMVPEPASSLLKIAEVPPKNPPVPPVPLGTVKRDSNGLPVLDLDGHPQLDQPLQPDQLVESPDKAIDDPDPKIRRSYYGDWIARFQVAGVEPPPPETITVAKSFSEQPSSRNIHAQGVLTIDDGYAAYTFSAGVAWRVDDSNSQLSVIIGDQVVSWTTSDGPKLTKSGGDRNFTGLVQDQPLAPDSKNVPQPAEGRSIAFSLQSVFTETAAANVEVKCIRTAELMAKWQLQVYDKIAARWQQLQADYEEKMAALQFSKAATGPLGTTNPDINRLIEQTELKRACIAILDNSNATVRGLKPNVAVQIYPDPSGPLQPDSPLPLPEPVIPDPNAAAGTNLMLAEELGANVRWFEQAFEWDKIGYVFYPYFWGRREEWVERLNLKNDDPLFEKFLQAGYARVAIPVRNGFEDAVNFYLLTGIPWMGGGLPKIGDHTQNPLYLSIVEEMKEQSGAPGDEKPSDQPPWWIRIPTQLIRLRKDDMLPTWTRGPKENMPPDDDWTWTDGPPKP